jgi:hypothetical protein
LASALIDELAPMPLWLALLPSRRFRVRMGHISFMPAI